MFFSPMVDPKWPPKWPSGGQPWDQLISLSAVKKQKFSFPPSCSGGELLFILKSVKYALFHSRWRGPGWILCYSQLVAIYFTKLHTEQLYSGENKLKCCHSSLVFAAIIHHGKCSFSPSLAPLSSTLVVLWLTSTFTLWLKE